MTRSLSATAAFAGSVVRELRWRIPLAGLVTLGIAVTEGAGLLLIIPLLGAVGLDVSDGATGPLAQRVTAGFAALGLAPSLPAVLCVFVAVTAAHALLYGASLVLHPRMEQRYALALRQRLYAAVVRARWSYLGRRRIADVLHALTTESDRAATAVSHLLVVGTGLAVSAVYLAMALRLSPTLTVLVGICGAALLYTLRGRTHQSASIGEEYVAATRRQFQVATDSLNGLKVLKSLGAEDRAVAAFGRAAVARVDVYFRLLSGFAQSKIALDVGAAVLMSVLLFVAVRYLDMRGATLLMLIVVFSRIMPRVMSLQSAAQTVAANLASIAVITRIIDDCLTQAEPPSGLARHGHWLTRGIRFERVSFTYPDGTPALAGLDLEICPGSCTAIVGASGAGKSTVADLLLGLLRPSSGTILVDEDPLQDDEVQRWRHGIGYVPQDGFFLPGSVRENLLWAKPDASEDELWAALERAEAAAFVRARRDGLDTLAGDGGTQFSGGERQRLALARALLLHPGILVLDEATSALDLANERTILRAVGSLDRAVTRVIITHRLVATRDADVIYVLDAGRVVEAGTWEELTCRPGPFAQLLTTQGSDDPSLFAPARLFAAGPN